MSENETSPLLGAVAKDQNISQNQLNSGETTPLLSGNAETSHYDGDADRDTTASIRSRHSDVSSTNKSKKKSWRWASGIAITILTTAIIVITILAFILPATVQEYAQQATVIEPTNLSLDSITVNGVRARIQADFHLDASKVENQHVRRLGRAATWVAYQLGTEETEVTVYLPEYDNVLLGSTVIPPLVINLRDGDTTQLDFVAEIKPGELDGIRTIANEWLEGKLKSLRLDGKTDLTLRSGILPLGTHAISESLVFEANKIPAMPKYNIGRLYVEDGPVNGSMVADVALSAFNTYPIQLDIPELGFDILVSGCDSDDLILVADAVTSEVHVEPQSEVEVDVKGVIRELSESLTNDCPDSSSSPLDILLQSFMHGEPATLFVRGSSHPDSNTPQWIAEILSSVTLPVPFPGRSLDGLIRNFSLTDVHFTMPDPFAEPGDPEANPKVSGTILVIAGVPDEMNFGINVTNVKARADVLYKGDKMGELNLKEWQHANSTRVEGKDEATLRIESRVEDVPLNITDSDVFSNVLQKLLFGGKPVILDIDAAVDIKVETALGKLIVKDVPAEGKIPVKPLPKGSLGEVTPKVGSLRILDTTTDTMTLQAVVNVTNPTPYTAHIPYANIHILHNDTVIGDATVEDLDIIQGPNANIVVTATWNPTMGGKEGQHIARELISQYLSGYNTTLTVKAHHDSIPGQPILCDALSRFNATFSTPRLDGGGDNDDDDGDDKPHFIRDATFHFLSSTATFTLVSPLAHNTVYLDYVNATAFYNHTEPIGRIEYDLPFAAPPGRSQTPRLPVSWSVDSVGYDAIRRAIGGSGRLKLDAFAVVDVRLGNWRERVWYKGRGIGARVTL